MIWKDRRFWTVVIDGLVSGATLLIGRFVAPDYMEIALWAVGFYQSVAATLIGFYTVDHKVEEVRAVQRGIQAEQRALRELKR